jgi:hypothetical protein
VCLSAIIRLDLLIRLGRLFSLTFIEVPAGGLPKRKGQVKDKDKKKKDPELGSWVVSLSLLEPSQETPISARLIIDAVTTPGSGGRAAVDLRIALAKDWKLGAKEESKKKIAEEAVASLRDSLAGRAMEFECVRIVRSAIDVLTLCLQRLALCRPPRLAPGSSVRQAETGRRPDHSMISHSCTSTYAHIYASHNAMLATRN